MITENYTLPACWASALINDDYSGLEESDITALEAWRAANDKPDIVSCSEEAYFSRYHDALPQLGLACTCLNYTAITRI